MPTNSGHADERAAIESFGERLRRLRLANGLSLKKLGAASKLDASTIWKLESGKSAALQRTILALSEHLGVSPRFLQCGTESGAPHRNDRCMRGADPILLGDGAVVIPLTQGQAAVVDASSYPDVRNQVWFAQLDAAAGSYYAHGMTPRINGCRELVLMHRVVVGAPPNLDVDHVDHDTLNNRRSNLRTATLADNMHNRHPKKNRSARCKGVTRRQHGWEAAIRIDGRQLHLGSFRTEEGAARAYDSAARKHYGEFAYTNLMAGLLPSADSDPVSD